MSGRLLKPSENPVFFNMGVQTLKPDSKGRVSLKRIAGDVSAYICQINDDGSMLLSPVKKTSRTSRKDPVPANVPAREKWLYANPAARKALEQGLKQAAEGNVRDLGSFAKHAG